MARPADPDASTRPGDQEPALDEIRIPTDAVDVWLAAWEIEATEGGLNRLTGSYWNEALDWIVERWRRPSPGRPGRAGSLVGRGSRVRHRRRGRDSLAVAGYCRLITVARAYRSSVALRATQT